MSTVSLNEIGQEFVRNKIGLVGIGILVALFIISAMAALTIPLETLKTWNNPESWLEFPKTALPVWVNLFLSEKIPEHKILTSSEDSLQSIEELTIFSQQFSVVYEFADFPNDFIYEFTAKYSGSPLLQISVIRPDGMTVELLTRSLPYLESAVHHERVFSTDNAVKKNLFLQSEKFGFPLNDISAEQIVFSESSVQKVLNGKYV
ncbi:MAG: ABC transporter permease, partial [Thermoproteota archaeon]